MVIEISKRTNWFDGQNVTENDLDTEQNAWHSTVSAGVDLLAGSGVQQEFSTQPILLDTSNVPSSISNLITTQNFDGEPIYPIDSFGNTTFTQPSDSLQGNQLVVEILGSSLDGSARAKVYIFGTIFGGYFKQEVFVFEDNGTKTTKNYYTSIVAIMTQDFRGNQNTVVDGTASRNNGGVLRILEALPMKVARDTIMSEQSQEPNQDYINFKPANSSKTLNTVLDEIAATEGLDKDDLEISTTSTSQRTLDSSDNGVIIGEKFKATTNNIQKITILLSVEENTLAVSGEEFNWSGDIVVGIRKLQTSNTCPVDTIPDTLIEFDPEPSSLSEISFDQSDLESLGVALNATPQEVDFVFTGTPLANPAVSPTLVVGEYYILTIRRTGNINTGTIVLEEASNTDASPTDTDEKRMTVFAQNDWIDVPESDLWYKIHTDAVRIVNGRAIDGGVQITSPKVKKNTATGIDEPFIEGKYNLLDTSSTGENYIIVQRANEFTDVGSHPSTGNSVFTRISDEPDVSVISQSTLSTLLDANNNTVILGMAVDDNPVGNPTITGTTSNPGLQNTTTFTIINPSSDITTNNLVGSILIPNTNDTTTKYKIIKVDTYTDLYGADKMVDNCDPRIIDSTCQQIIDTALRTGAKVIGPVPLPSRRTSFVVNKAAFIDKDAREHFELKTHKRLIDILTPTDSTIENLIHLDLPSGVNVEIKM